MGTAVQLRRTGQRSGKLLLLFLCRGYHYSPFPIEDIPGGTAHVYHHPWYDRQCCRPEYLLQQPVSNSCRRFLPPGDVLSRGDVFDVVRPFSAVSILLCLPSVAD